MKHEEVIGDIDGYVIDIETTIDFEKRSRGDSREHKNLRQVILGYINGYELRILCAHGIEGIPELAEATKKILRSLKKPY